MEPRAAGSNKNRSAERHVRTINIILTHNIAYRIYTINVRPSYIYIYIMFSADAVFKYQSLGAGEYSTSCSLQHADRRCACVLNRFPGKQKKNHHQNAIIYRSLPSRASIYILLLQYFRRRLYTVYPSPPPHLTSAA